MKYNSSFPKTGRAGGYGEGRVNEDLNTKFYLTFLLNGKAGIGKGRERWLVMAITLKNVNI